MSIKLEDKKISITEVIQLFQINPEQAFQKLVSSSYYFHKQPKNFWNAYMKLDHESLYNQFPDSVETFNQVVWLKFFFDLHEFYLTEKVKEVKAVIALNPDETSLIKSFFLCLELGETVNEPNNFPNYSEETLEGIKILLKEILPLLNGINKTSYSTKLVQLANNLIKIQTDLALLKDFLDAFVWADFEMTNSENGFKLSLPFHNSKTENLFVLNTIKSIIKRDFKREESHPQISKEEHFVKVDPVLKTNQGLATAFISGGTIINQEKGTTFIQKEENYFQDLNLNDPTKIEELTLRILKESQEQNFHYQFRNALSQIYQPNDEIDIHALHVEIETNTFVSLYELICAMSCLIAKADTFRYISESDRKGNIKSFFQLTKDAWLNENPGENIELLEENIINWIISDLTKLEVEQKLDFFFQISEDAILEWFSKIEELKLKTQKELKSIINLFSKLDSPLKINPIYKNNNKYYFSYITCRNFNLNQLLYDNYISDKLFKSAQNQQSNEKKIIGENHKKRENRFANSLKELFQTITPFVEASLDYSDPKLNFDFGDLKGEFDVIAYFEKENIIFPIQIKLSNTSPRTEKRKAEWISTNIESKGIKQVIRDIKLLHTKSGLKFVSAKLRTKKEIISPLIYPIIVTDNFFADHCMFLFNENEDSVQCISYFELKHLLLNQRVHDKQTDWLPFDNMNSASYLIELIENNTFWGFINEFAESFNFSKKLSAISEEWKIELKI